MQTQSTDTTELHADAKQVYSGSLKTLWDLAGKYNVSTASYANAKENPSDAFITVYVQAFPSKSAIKEMQSKLYAAIKGQIRELEG